MTGSPKLTHLSERPSVSELVNRLGSLIDHLVAAFTPQRCMFASNFPVDRVSADYATIVQAIRQITASRGSEAQRGMFADNAATFYRI